VYAALGLAFHLEPLESSDVARLEAASDRIASLIGPRLRWAWSAVHPQVEPFSTSAFDLVAQFPGQLADPAAAIEDPRRRAGTSAMNAAHYDKFGVACHGGTDRNHASPWSFRFHAAVTSGSAERLRADTMIAATMALTTPPAVLRELALALAGILRIRWGAAGLAYGAWELDRYGETRNAIYAHARRHPGFDVGQHATWMRELCDHVRTVSWLTFLGPVLAKTVRASGGALTTDHLVTVAPCGDALVLEAGEAPLQGDVNRRDVPHAYVEVDRRIRAVRAAEGVHFYAPWSLATTEAWLRRFETDRQS
jgi:hypothetical protein